MKTMAEIGVFAYSRHERENMDEDKAQEYFLRYRAEIEALTGMLFKIGSEGDEAALNWAISCFSMCAALTRRHILATQQAAAPDLVRHEPLN